MTNQNPKTTMSSSAEVRESLTLYEVKHGLQFSLATLKLLLTTVEQVLFFGKVYDLTYEQLSRLLYLVIRTDLTQALSAGDHSTDLQGYLLEPGWLPDHVRKGNITLSANVPQGEILPELWKSLEVEVAQSIKDVAAKLQSVIGLMPGKQGSMVFGSMMKLNVKRPSLGDYRAKVHHAPALDNLVIFDVSGSMTENTVRTIVSDVVALSYTANAHLAVVSNTTTHWEPGSFNVDDVLAACEFGGTQYETLAPLFDRDWGTVVCIADYDSSYDAAKALRRNATGRIDTVLDVSLVNRPTYLAECIGQLADTVRPLLVAPHRHVLRN